MTTAAERRGLDLSSAPEDAQAVLNRLMFLEDENERYREALEDAAEYLRLASTWIDDTDRHLKMLRAHGRAREALGAADPIAPGPVAPSPRKQGSV